MYIQEVIIDGFKSYAQRTVVSGFDPQFNAITGLNGTGKSNILDSICFVLGIQNLSQVRVGNLQELVYKQGQAGVTKASVTIVFNNNDPSGSPVGYESSKQITVTRQIVIGGKNKYMINGHTVQQSQVQNLFHSVQLNVNNPHFLIMQGRITKVLNMKPVEILSMIEEAAGTRMFETKKQAAIKTIEKKQLKVDELSKCMNEEITPTLENLRGQKQEYQTWIGNSTEVEQLERFCIAFEYLQCEEKVLSAERDKAEMEDQRQQLQKIQDTSIAEAEECGRKIKEIETLRETETEGPMKELKIKEDDLSKDLVKFTAHFNNHKETFCAEKDALTSINKQINATTAAHADKLRELEACSAECLTMERNAQTAEEASVTLREKYQNACAGVADETSADLLSLPEQVATWEKKAREAQSQLQQGSLRADHAREALKELRKAQKAQAAGNEKAIRESDAIRTKMTRLEHELQSLHYSESEEMAVRAELSRFMSQTAALRDQVGTLTSKLDVQLRFAYKDPEPGFDRSRVKGLVAKLVRVRDSQNSTALEITAGAKLYQVVVDTEKTSELILQKGNLKKRVTVIPLNKINSRCVDPAKVAAAKSIAAAHGGTATLALELVGYEEEVHNAMAYVFGNALVCNSADVAKQIAFDKLIRTRTVTLDGDTYDPSGTMNGGAKTQYGQLLCKIEELGVAQERLVSIEAQVRLLEMQLGDMEAAGSRVKDIMANLDLTRQSLRMIEDKMADSSYAQIATDIAEQEQQLETLQKDAVSLKATADKAKQELAKLKDAEAGIKKRREKAMQEIEGQMKAAQKQASTLKSQVAVIKAKRESLGAEAANLLRELQALKEQLAICNSSVSKLTTESEALTLQITETRARYDAAKKTLAEKQAELNRCSKEIKALEAAREKAAKCQQSASLEARKLTHKLKEWEKDAKDAVLTKERLVKNHPWIEREREFFGRAGSDFDFAANDIQKQIKRLKQKKGEQDALAKKVNKKVMGMIDKAESEYAELNKKKEVILKDKEKIEAVIDELDIKKTQALQTTWIKVNRDFGSIFSMLLPGTQAKLEPPEGQAVTDGLEVKVAFNGVWKDSLTELSGGQRSLLALSLILALLLFKPAPMYILDEVDAALDLSHTQNIGLMLRTHFSSSQFIVVSLKEGMFNNANVIFRTRFVDGVSAVTRTVVGGKSRPQLSVAMTEVEDEAGPKKKKGKGTAASSRMLTDSIEA